MKPICSLVPYFVFHKAEIHRVCYPLDPLISPFHTHDPVDGPVDTPIFGRIYNIHFGNFSTNGQVEKV